LLAATADRHAARMIKGLHPLSLFHAFFAAISVSHTVVQFGAPLKSVTVCRGLAHIEYRESNEREADDEEYSTEVPHKRPRNAPSEARAEA
jgi:hypothetical protein